MQQLNTEISNYVAVLVPVKPQYSQCDDLTYLTRHTFNEWLYGFVYILSLVWWVGRAQNKWPSPLKVNSDIWHQTLRYMQNFMKTGPAVFQKSQQSETINEPINSHYHNTSWWIIIHSFIHSLLHGSSSIQKIQQSVTTHTHTIVH